MIPFIDLKPYVRRVMQIPGAVPKHLSDFTGGFEWDFNTLVDSCDFIGGGAATQKFETALAQKLDVRHVVSCANGTDALQLALRACGIGRGHRVAIPNLTFWATLEAVVNVGATPVLLDTQASGQLSFDELVRAHADHGFDAIVMVHLYGWCHSGISDFRAFAREKKIPLIEDGAQAFGATVDNDGPNPLAGRSAFHDADVATLSFYPAKVLGGIGDGGAVVCKDQRTADRVRLLANHGRTGHFEHATPGWNSRLDSIQASWLTHALDVIDDVLKRRCAIFERYWGGLLHTSVDPLREGDDVYHNGYLMPVQVRGAAAPAFAAQLRERGVETRRVYPRSLADQPGAAGYTIPIGPLLNSRSLAASVVCLPIWYGMTDEQVDEVLAAVRSTR